MGFYDDPTYLQSAYKIFQGVDYIPDKVFWELRIGVYYPIAFFWKLFSINDLSASIYFILCSLGSIVVTYYIAKEFFSVRVALFSSFLLSIFPLNIIYSTQIGPDIPFQFLTGLAVLFFIYQEKNKPKSSFHALFCGIFIGFSYTVRSTVILLLPLFLCYIFLQVLKNRDLKYLFNRKKMIRYFLILLGFFLIFSVQLVHFYNITGEWFYVENGRGYNFSHGLNDNSNHWWYPAEMFSFESDIIRSFGVDLKHHIDDSYGYFDTIHDEPLFGFLYYFVVSASIWFLYKRESNTYFFILWWSGFFFFFEFFLQFYCTTLCNYCVYGRAPRFLTSFSIPAVILAGKFLYFDKASLLKGDNIKKIRSSLCILFIIFLISTSIVFAYQGSKFLRNGMGDVRETVEYLQSLPPKTIYVSHPEFIYKSKYFFRYNETYLNNIKLFNCDEIDCDNFSYDAGDFISDSYVVIKVLPYWKVWKDSLGFPSFFFNPPKNWVLLKEIKLDNYGIFKEYNPKIYYAP